jgi:hypothetical protein
MVRVTNSLDVPRLFQLGRAVAGVMRLRLHRVAGEVRERIARAVRRDLAGDGLERGCVPEEAQELAAAAVAQHQGQALHGHDRPRRHRHDDQDRQQRLADSVALAHEVGEARVGRDLRVQGHLSRAKSRGTNAQPATAWPFSV